MSTTTHIDASEQVGNGDVGTLRRVGRALVNPKLVWWSLNARRHLIHCDVLPLTVRLRGRARVENRGRIEVGDRVLIDGRTVLVELAAQPGGRIVIGERTFINYGTSISAHEEVRIGAGCLIGNYTLIMDNDYHDMQDHLLPGASAPIVLEDRVWLGARVTVLKGVRIGENSVVGAGSVVTRDIPAGVFAAGMPARVIREL